MMFSAFSCRECGDMAFTAQTTKRASILLFLSLVPLMVFIGKARYFEVISQQKLGMPLVGERADTHTVSPDNVTTPLSPWQQTRKMLLSQDLPRKVFMLTYMRGGSSTIGEIFNSDPKAVLWYEPLDQFYCYFFGFMWENIPQDNIYLPDMTRRSLRTLELRKLVEFFSHGFQCDYDKFSAEIMAHYFIRESDAMDGYLACFNRLNKYNQLNNCKRPLSRVCGMSSRHALDNQCHILIYATEEAARSRPNSTNLLVSEEDVNWKLEQLKYNLNPKFVKNVPLFIDHYKCISNLRTEVNKCLPNAISRCRKSTVHAMEVNRIKMEDVEPIILAHPDIYVIHYTRDPRGIANSRIHTSKLMRDKKDRRPAREAQYLCQRMQGDLDHRRRLEEKYPGIFLHVRYEDLASDPIGTAANIYSHINKPYPKLWTTFVQKNMHSRTAEATGNFGISVQNATKTALKWLTAIPKDQLVQIDGFCKQTLKTLNHPLYSELPAP